MNKLQKVKQALRQIQAMDGELNMSNYGEDDICHLNQQFIRTYEIATEALAELNEFMERLESEELVEKVARMFGGGR